MSEAATPKSPLPPPPPIAGIGVAAVIMVGIFGWVALGSSFLSEPSLFAGFMVLWYWAKVEHLDMAKLPAAILGALTGIGLAWAMFLSAATFGGPGFALGLGLLLVAIYLDVIEIWPLFVNAATMLFSIVAAAPLVQFHVNWMELFLAALVGGLFFGAYVAALMWLAGKVGQRPA